jgi:hypothetical protein
MIKPFKILETRPIDGHGTGVTYRVWRTEWAEPGRSRTIECQSFMIVPEGRDIDEYLFQALSEAGWI